MTAIHDLAALCAAIDAGDDGALPVLADALEEQGDPRAEGLRLALAAGRRPLRTGDGYAWQSSESVGLPTTAAYSQHAIGLQAYGRLRHGWVAYGLAAYTLRSAAYLALAAALVAAGGRS